MGTANKLCIILGLIMIFISAYQFSNGTPFGEYISNLAIGAALAGSAYFEITKTNREQS